MRYDVINMHYQLGFDYEYGRNGKVQNMDKALSEFEFVAELGDPDGFVAAARCIMHLVGLNLGRIKWYIEKGVKNGSVEAKNMMGYGYLNGKFGYARDVAKGSKLICEAMQEESIFTYRFIDSKVTAQCGVVSFA